MAEQLLQGLNRHPVIERARGKGVSKLMGRDMNTQGFGELLQMITDPIRAGRAIAAREEQVILL